LGLVVQAPSDPRDQPLRHELADEHDAALLAEADVEAQVQLGEVAVAWPADAHDAGVEELEGNQADEDVAVAQVERQARRQPLLEQRRRHGVGGEEQVVPFGGQERTGHGGSRRTSLALDAPSRICRRAGAATQPRGVDCRAPRPDREGAHPTGEARNEEMDKHGLHLPLMGEKPTPAAAPASELPADAPLKDRIVAALRTIYDPEIPANVHDLGLIYDLKLTDKNEVAITMTLTSP